MNLVFLVFNDNLFALNQFDTFINSELTISFNFHISLPEKNKFVSSANNMNSRRSEQFTISFIYRIKSNGPKMDPCGTP